MLYHLPLEGLKSRFTEFLEDIEFEAFNSKFSRVQTVKPLDWERKEITRGEVLDVFGRPQWCLQQMSELMTLLEGHQGETPNIYFSDFYTTGLDALAYSRMQFRAYSFCWADTFDIFDFTFQHHFMWMRAWECMALSVYHRVFVASEVLRQIILAVMGPGYEARVVTVGLPFSPRHISQQLKTPSEKRNYDVVYSSRLDLEKNPQVLVSLIRARPDLKFAICTAFDRLRGTDTKSVKELLVLTTTNPNVHLFTGLTKEQYYGILSESKVQLNTSLQDWVSYTLLEALTFGCLPLYPMFRSFPETFGYDENYLYEPENPKAAIIKLDKLLAQYPYCARGDMILAEHSGTMKRITEIILNDV